jgi:GTP pyrophosphokinase
VDAPRRLTELLQSATIAVAGTDGARLGTGFALTPELVVTCAHVVAKDASTVPDRVQGLPDLSLTASAQRYHRDSAGLDLAVLRLAATDAAPALPLALLHPEVGMGDRIWAFGYPDNRFRGGQPATFVYEGSSRVSPADDRGLLRLRGTPVGPGFSGSPALNLRTGAVCGMLVTSDVSGSAHLLSSADILELCPEADVLISESLETYGEWLSLLDDDQLTAAGWRFAGPRLREYIRLAVRSARRHPYPDSLIGKEPPPLSDVYVHQLTKTGGTPDPDDGFRNTRTVPADRIFAGHEANLLVGSPGSGKTSLLHTAVTTALDNRSETSTAAVPIHLDATRLVSDRPMAEILTAAVTSNLTQFGAREEWPADFFRRPPVRDGRWLILVDGLDEIIDARRRDAVCRRLEELDRDPDNPYRFVIATRPLPDLISQGSPWRPAVYELLPFDQAQLETFATRWFAGLGLPGPPQQSRQFVAAADRSGLGDLAFNPLMAMMLCQVYAKSPGSPLPVNRNALYSRFTDLLVQQQYADADRGVRDQIIRALKPFGHRAESAGEDLVSLIPDLIYRLASDRRGSPRLSAIAALTEWTNHLRPPQVDVPRWQSLLRAALSRSGLLMDKADDFEFLHLTIQEYLAARHVAMDADRTAAAYAGLFAPASGDAPAPLSLWQQSYTRFLIAIWQDRIELAEPLRRLAAQGGLAGGQLIAALIVDGLAVDNEARSVSFTRLSAIVTADGTAQGDRTAALDALAVLNLAATVDVLENMVRNAAQLPSLRLFALDAFAQLVFYALDPSQGRPEPLQPPETRWRMHSLAAARHARTDAVLAGLASDRTMHATDRWAAAEALSQLEAPGSIELLQKLSADSSLGAAVQGWTAEALRRRGSRPAPAPAPIVEEPRREVSQFAVPTGRRVQARLARFTAPWQSTQVSEVLEPLIAIHRASHPKADGRVLQRAFDVAARRHSGRYRYSGDPYITHPLAVATILANLGRDTTTVVAALLHDTTRNTDYDLEQLRAEFGHEVALLVDGVTAAGRVELNRSEMADTARRFVIALAKDPRVLVVKLACRLHDMRTLNYVPRREQRVQRAEETLEILAPLAHRLGLNAIKWELEDLAFSTLSPQRFEDVNRLVGEHQPQREALLRQVMNRVVLDLKAAKVKAEVTGRPKHLYAIHQKMIARGPDFNDIHDLAGVRILADTVRDCYAALGVIHTNWQPVPGRFKDYLTTPKYNLYQSLHTTVNGPTGKPIEMEIRTYAMHRTAEYGTDVTTWLRQLLDWQREASDPSEFLDALLFERPGQEIFVGTPKGDVIALPTGSTPLDFAYAVHTDVGHKCIGARVNGKLMPIESALSDGDIVEIFLSKSATAGPAQEWLTFVESPRARTKIRQFFAADDQQAAIETGKQKIVDMLSSKRIPIQKAINRRTIGVVAEAAGATGEVEDFYLAVADGRINAEALAQFILMRFDADDIDGLPNPFH